MCELFAMSAGQNYTAQEYLPVFADKSRDNISGWGIGFFRNGQVYIEKSCEGIYAGDQVHDSFQRLARVVDSRIIISHIRCPKAGHQKESQAQPLSATFWTTTGCSALPGNPKRAWVIKAPGPSWRGAAGRPGLRICPGRHGGPAAGLAQPEPLPGSGGDLQEADHRLPGEYIFFLANETVLFAFLNNGQVLTYHPPEAQGESLVLTTVSGGLTRDPDHWRAYPNPDPSRGQILIISGADLLYQGHL